MNEKKVRTIKDIKAEKMDKAEKAYEKVIQYIKNEIRLGSLKRGQKLPPERELADALGVSRNSVREALRTLDYMGFISSTQGAGNYVTCDFERCVGESMRYIMLLGETNFLQISQLRCGLESEAAKLAAARILPKQLARMQELALLMRTEGNSEKVYRYDLDFHRLLCEASGNHLILSFFSAMLRLFEDFITTMHRRIIQDSEQAEKLYLSHEHLVEALVAHDGDAAFRTVWDHFEIVDRSIAEGNIL
ncbi:MAG: FadR family transcriptional regulator [Clostridiaceae bacterium]|nr:FadR family transcriptional regulator [Clostridiaceae bacterium]